jgi:branched-subunit amino acid transport protein
MTRADAWVPILAAAAATQLLRLVPLLLVRRRGRGLPRTLERALEAAGFATVGGLIGLVVFRPPAQGAVAGREVLMKVGALAVAFLLYLRLGKGLLCLAAGYGLYLVMTLAGR